ncbi:MAG: phosphatase PAP2 family protein [Candidatus Aenigmarchaeota archaeon]|nr:phosphatase PAP2 family protein [Candidatus Aenigmarchaeota archaeon]
MPPLVELFRIFTEAVPWITAFFVLPALLTKRKYLHMAIYVTSLLLTYSLVSVIKEMTDIPRPAFGLVEESGPSFPSAHAAFGFFPLGFYWKRSRVLARSVLFIYGILAAYSRLVLNVHYPIDVISGSVLGFLIPYVAVSKEKQISRYISRLYESNHIRKPLSLVMFLVFIPSLVLAQSVVSHPAADVTPGNFTGDFRFTNGFLYIGDALGGVSANGQRTYLAAPDGSVKLSAYNDRVEIGTGGLKFADGSTMASAATQLWQSSGTNVYYTGGKVLFGSATPYSYLGAWDNEITTAGERNGPLWMSHFSNTVSGPLVNFAKSRGASAGSYAVVQNGDYLGTITWTGSLGGTFSDNQNAAYIRAAVDAAPTSGHIPGRIEFWTASGGSNTMAERMRITSSGNVGIGTLSPEKNLHIAGTNPGLIVDGGASSTPYVGINGPFRWQIYSDGADSGKLKIRGSTIANNFAGNPAGWVTVDTSGNVGIGTTTPAAALEVVRGTGSATIQAKTTGPGQAYLILKGPTQEWQLYDYDDVDDSFRIWSPTVASATGAGDAFTIKSTGNVGIGTTSPAGKLDIAGSLCISGACRTSWPSGEYQLIASTSVGFTEYTAVSMPSKCISSGCDAYLLAFESSGAINGMSTMFYRQVGNNAWRSNVNKGSTLDSGSGTNGDGGSSSVVWDTNNNCVVYDDSSGTENSPNQWALYDQLNWRYCELWVR